jgi:hypothetical protein
MKVYVPIYMVGGRDEYETIVPGIFCTKKDAVKRLVELLFEKQRIDLESYNERANYWEEKDDREHAYYLISKNKELKTTEELVNRLVQYVGEDISKLIDLIFDQNNMWGGSWTIYGVSWSIRLDEMEVE